ncbi:hypothetical protein F5148DRAFT_1283648 [Russula earlei]|uniref:Uncharacterized protein n=1 Tax=Russula earlei TaxID=71964 RepID=A0ACC0UBT5_9AGAM|nr:hypothetical protein F5148DRAFT_1283648 [Russula earlei]
MTNQSLLTRELLEGMKRSDLQRVCKERGLKANLKTEAMIELLLDSPPSQSRRTSHRRAASTRNIGRQPSTRSRLHSTSTMIVHSDTDEDEDDHAVKPESDAPSGIHPGPMTRTRKARDAQLQLGIGRPAVAGGRGPRPATRSVSATKGTRSRSGRGVKPSSALIVEDRPSAPRAGTPEGAPPAPSNHGTPPPRPIENGRIRRASIVDIATNKAGIGEIVEEQVRPLQHTVASLQKQIQQQASAHAREVAALNDRVMTVTNELRELQRHAESIQLLRCSMEQLQAELSRIRQSGDSEPLHDSPNISTPTTMRPDSSSHLTNVRPHRPIESTRHSRVHQSSPAFEYPPPPAGSPAKPPSRDAPMRTSILGRRQRSADAGDSTTASETDQEDIADKESHVALHHQGRKRAKKERSADDEPEAPPAGPSNTAAHEQPEMNTRSPPSETTPRRPDRSSTAASRDHVVGDVIFTDQDFDFFDNPTNLHPTDSQLNPYPAAENHPFTFAFPGVTQPPATSTPVPTAPLLDPSSSPTLGTLPYPERPHSPSPAPIPHRAVRRPSQSEAFRPFGLSPESRSLPGFSGNHGSAIDPTSLLHTPPHPPHDAASFDPDPIDNRRRTSSNEVGAGLGMTSLPMRSEDTPAALVRRTMYGTELEGDTRFGDFGVEGVATGFWTGAKF